MVNILDRLSDGRPLLMDGGTGSELQRRGVNVSKSSIGTNVGPWSARALKDAPDLVLKVHEDYLKAGAEIIITNTFYSSRSRLDMDGLGDKWEEYTRLAGELAVRARDNINPKAFVAGGIAPTKQGSEKIYQEMSEQSQILAESGVDLMLPEYVGPVEDCITCLKACSKVGLPVFLGIKHVSKFLKDPKELVHKLANYKVDAILGMCSSPEDLSDTLPNLIQAYDGIVGAYANIGYGETSPDPNNPNKQVRVIDWGENTPDNYIKFGKTWLDMGAQVIGGCCSTGPEHIEALKPIIQSK